MSSESFRKLSEADADAMAGLERECFSLPWSLEQCRGALRQGNFAAFGLWRQNLLLAYVSIYHARPEIEIINVATARNERRGGLARRLLHLVLQAAVKMGMQKATLEVRESNLAAIALYRSLGFRETGKRLRYYPDSGEDALIFVFNF